MELLTAYQGRVEPEADREAGGMHKRRTDKDNVLATVMALCGLALMCSQTGHAATLRQGAVVRMEPAEQVVQIGESVVTDIYVADITNLYGADVRVSFNSALMEVVDANLTLPGVQVTLGPLLTGGQYFAIRNEADNNAGVVWVALTQLNPTPPVTGSGALARITWRALCAGVSPVVFASVDLADRNGVQIAATTQDGQVTVVPTSSFQYNVRLPIILWSFP